MAADTRPGYNTKAHQSNEINGLFLMSDRVPQGAKIMRTSLSDFYGDYVG